MRRAQQGFTLMEVIVAISLMAFALALAFGSLRGATRATERSEAVARGDEQLRAVQGFLRTQLTGAMPVAFEFNSETGEATFLRASPAKIQFVATMPGYLSRGGPYLQTLELVPGKNGRQLVFQHQLLGSEGALEAEREPVVLLEGVGEGGFEVRALDERAQPGRWEREWEVSAQLPPMLRLRLAFRDPGRNWPEFVVSPRLGVASAGNAPVPLANDR